MNSSESLKKSQLEVARVGRLLLTYEDGKLLMGILMDMYYKGDLVGGDTHDTYRRLGRRDVVEFLLSMRDKAEKEQ